jgi:hypothetical protein
MSLGQEAARTSHRWRLATLVALILVGSARGDVFFLDDGDRITGKLLSEGKRSFRIQTAYGRLVVPRAHILRFVRDDGTEVAPNPTPTPVPTPTPNPLCTVQLELSGSVFWYAWSPSQGEEVDPTLRFRLLLDGSPLATFTDAVPDPGAVDAPIVNRFSFSDVSLEPAPEVRLSAPELASGRVRLRLELPAEKAGPYRLQVAYQKNDGTVAEPAFTDLLFTDIEVALQPGQVAAVALLQDRGRMEYSGLFRKRLKNVDTFRLELRSELGS